MTYGPPVPLPINLEALSISDIRVEVSEGSWETDILVLAQVCPIDQPDPTARGDIQHRLRVPTAAYRAQPYITIHGAIMALLDHELREYLTVHGERRDPHLEDVL